MSFRHVHSVDAARGCLHVSVILYVCVSVELEAGWKRRMDRSGKWIHLSIQWRRFVVVVVVVTCCCCCCCYATYLNNGIAMRNTDNGLSTGIRSGSRSKADQFSVSQARRPINLFPRIRENSSTTFWVTTYTPTVRHKRRLSERVIEWVGFNDPHAT